jgi:hypothetical protein
MEKSAENLYVVTPAERLPGSLDLDFDLRSLLSDVIRQCSKKREQIAEEMSQLLDRAVSVPMLNAFTADSREGHRFPAAWVPAFCSVTGDIRLLQLIARSACLYVVDEKSINLIQFGEALLRKEQAEREMAELRERLSGAAQ